MKVVDRRTSAARTTFRGPAGEMTWRRVEQSRNREPAAAGRRDGIFNIRYINTVVMLEK